MGRLGVAGRIVVLDSDLHDTTPAYVPTFCDVVSLLQKGDKSCDELAQSWLGMIGGDNDEH